MPISKGLCSYCRNTTGTKRQTPAGSASIGWLIPTVLRLLKLEPQVAAGPIALACADMVTIIIYFSIAFLFLRGTLLH